MVALKILFGAIVGTSLMTTFSYLVAAFSNRQFKEPVLLNKLYSRSQLTGSTSSNAVGWILHYLIGFIFTIIFHFIWQLTAVNVSYFSGTFLGLAAGFVGVSGWHILFKMHHNPPEIKFSTYYLHLLAAHIIFGLGAVAGYTLFNFK